LLFGAGLLLGGCAALEPVPSVESADQALIQARAEAQAGRWSQARRLLESAERKDPEDSRLPALRERLAQRWNMQRQQLEDELLTVRVQALRDEVRLLEPLLRAEPERAWQGLRLEHLRRELPARRAELMACAQRQLQVDLVLARRCVLLARRIEPGEDAERLIGAIDRRLASRYQARRAKARAGVARQTRSQIEAQLEQAEADLASGNFQDAADGIAEALERDPQHAEARQLQALLAERTAQRSGVLNELAARLYLEGQVEPAIGVWQASLEIAPEQPEIRERLERARRVRERLQELRDTQPTSNGSGSNGSSTPQSMPRSGPAISPESNPPPAAGPDATIESTPQPESESSPGAPPA
jgi:tetratricopeptide (TPR) repeat protein